MRFILGLLTLILLLSVTESCSQDGHYKKLLADQLDSVLKEDQKYRQMLSATEERYGKGSEEVEELWKALKLQDSINTVTVSRILDEYGWLGVEEIGENGNACLFLVIQHSTHEVREKYLPLMREAVRQGKARASDLAFLEDRVALGQGKKQIYGTQLYRNDTTGIFYFAPIEDELNVNKRRLEAGLGTLEDRAREFGFEYKAPEK